MLFDTATLISARDDLSMVPPARCRTQMKPPPPEITVNWNGPINKAAITNPNVSSAVFRTTSAAIAGSIGSPLNSILNSPCMISRWPVKPAISFASGTSKVGAANFSRRRLVASQAGIDSRPPCSGGPEQNTILSCQR